MMYQPSFGALTRIRTRGLPLFKALTTVPLVIWTLLLPDIGDTEREKLRCPVRIGCIAASRFRAGIHPAMAGRFDPAKKYLKGGLPMRIEAPAWIVRHESAFAAYVLLSDNGIDTVSAP